MQNELVIAIAIGTATSLLLLAGSMILWLRNIRFIRELDVASAEIRHLSNKLAVVAQEGSDFKNRYEDLQERHAESEKQLSSAQSRVQHLEEKLQDQRLEFSKQREEAKIQFENLAIRILDQSSEKLEQSSHKSLTNILSPLQQRLREFEEKVSNTYEQEARERFALKSELEKMILANQKISEDATNLTQALRGDVKQQGNWGELKLEMVLEKSGLREGEEYIREAKTMSLKGESGKSLRPDVIVHLPDDKHIIIDAKVSLSAYERWINQPDLTEKAVAIKDFMKSIKAHVDGLSAKKYDFIEGLSTPDFVLMFCPIESAFSLLMEQDRDLLSYAWEKRIMIVTPTTLLAGLRTIASVWKSERQSKNSLEIARQGGALYDKFAAFVADLEKVGKGISDSQKSYESALNKLTTGRGNLMSRVERLRELGAKTAKKLDVSDPKDLLEP